jgi:hypothetical protein
MKKEQQVWIHVYPLIETTERSAQKLEVTTSLSVVVYRDYIDAANAHSVSGGLLMKVPSSSLKGRAQAGCMHTVDSAYRELDKVDTEVWCHLAVGKSLPFTETRDESGGGDVTGWQFDEQGGNWISEFVEQSGIEVSL